MQSSRIDKVSLALVALCALTALAVWGTKPPHAANAPAVDEAQAPNQRPPLVTDAIDDIDDTVEPSLDDYLAIVDRPLFHPSRKPQTDLLDDANLGLPKANGALGSMSGAGFRPPPGSARRDAQNEFKLVGIVIDNDRRYALMRPTSVTTAQRVTLGEDIEGWTLANLTPSSVTINRGGETKTLELERKGDPQLAARAKALAKRKLDRAKLRDRMRKATAAKSKTKATRDSDLEKEQIEPTDEEEEYDDEDDDELG